MDRYGPRAVLIVSSIGMAAGLVGVGLLPRDLPSFAFAVVAASLLGSAQTGVPYTHVVVGWFQRQRGLALGVMLSFVGLGIATVPPTLSMIISTWGWRSAFVVAGMASMLVPLPVALFVIRDPPKRQHSQEVAGYTLREAVATSSFWLMIDAFLFNYLAAAAGSISLPTILEDRGMSAPGAAGAMTVVGAAFIAARLGFGALLDRFPPTALTCIFFLFPSVGHVLLASSDSVAAAYVSGIFFGLATGAEGDAMGYLLAKRFGMRSFGAIFGVNYFAFTCGAGLGPAVLNTIAAEGTRYAEAFAIFTMLGMLAPILLVIDWGTNRRRRSCMNSRR
ncbi:MFS transporter [Azospirillum canadense]|uniref:MFS transporter n=1 Tax=Azospirillum canadense TaxID=403962 RepID=UPI00222674A3|nr:MFS transporter [Azospirillum canadense]